MLLLLLLMWMKYSVNIFLAATAHVHQLGRFTFFVNIYVFFSSSRFTVYSIGQLTFFCNVCSPKGRKKACAVLSLYLDHALLEGGASSERRPGTCAVLAASHYFYTA